MISTTMRIDGYRIEAGVNGSFKVFSNDDQITMFTKLVSDCDEWLLNTGDLALHFERAIFTNEPYQSPSVLLYNGEGTKIGSLIYKSKELAQAIADRIASNLQG